MAGSEQYGPEHGRADFYKDSVCLMEFQEGVDPEVHARVKQLWQLLGARVVEIETATHDAILARTSHLPHILAAAIATCAGKMGDIQPFIGNGFRDTTRIAEGRPEVWRDICLTNRDAITDSLQVTCAPAWRDLEMPCTMKTARSWNSFSRQHGTRAAAWCPNERPLHHLRGRRRLR